MQLAGKPDWDRVQERYEAYWHGEIIDRPLVQIRAPVPEPTPSDEPAGEHDLVDWYTNPERVIPRLGQQVDNIYWCGDAFPHVFPVATRLVAIEAAYLGCPYHIHPANRVAWIEPIVDDWEDLPNLEADEDNFWWKATATLLELGAQQGVGRYHVGIPDMQGGGQIAFMLRGQQRMAVDLYDYPEQVKHLVRKVNEAWHYYYKRCYEIIHRWQEGHLDFLSVYSSRPAVAVECDASAMISPKMFQEFFLGALEQQTEWVERTIYHLDGPNQLVHLNEFLALPKLDGIQWGPGAGGGRMSDWIPLLKQIQDSGRLLRLSASPEEVVPLLRELKPEGVLLTTSCPSVAEADALLAEVNRMFGVAA